MTFRDGLAGLYNHSYFQDLMDKELSRSRRYKKPFSLMMFDLDHFKKINDEYGHPVGNLVLKQVCSAINDTIRDSDFVARYGGEEFAIGLPETKLRGAVIVAERLRKAIKQLEIDTNACNIDVTASVGVTCYHPSTEKIGSLKSYLKLTMPSIIPKTKVEI